MRTAADDVAWNQSVTYGWALICIMINARTSTDPLDCKN